MVDAYSATGVAWAAGPARVYARLAEVLVERCPGGVEGRTVLDLGAGTGVAGRAALAAGASRTVALDAAVGMLTSAGGVAGDLLHLPFANATFDAVVAAFSLNHVADPVTGLREAARMLRPGGALVAGTYAADDTHPVKGAADAAVQARGWRVPEWYEWVQAHAVPLLATVEGARQALGAAGLGGAVERVRVQVDGLEPVDLVEWRLGMAQLAPFVAGLTTAERGHVVADALDRLGDPPPLVRSVIVLTAVVERS